QYASQHSFCVYLCGGTAVPTPLMNIRHSNFSRTNKPVSEMPMKDLVLNWTASPGPDRKPFRMPDAASGLILMISLLAAGAAALALAEAVARAGWFEATWEIRMLLVYVISGCSLF